MLKSVGKAVAWLSVIMIPLACLYYFYGVGLIKKVGVSLYATASLGNLGQSGYMCAQEHLSQSHHMHFSCTVGKIEPALYVGLVPVPRKFADFTHRLDYCGDPLKALEPIKTCSLELMRRFDFEYDFRSECHGK